MRTVYRITAEWERPEGHVRGAHVYYVNGEPISTLIKEVHRHIRNRVAVPEKIIKAACMRAKETELAMRICFAGLDGWKVVRSL
jgi:hypothetical protein